MRVNSAIRGLPVHLFDDVFDGAAVRSVGGVLLQTLVHQVTQIGGAVGVPDHRSEGHRAARSHSSHNLCSDHDTRIDNSFACMWTGTRTVPRLYQVLSSF